ncbi:MAG: hypothetical protein IKB73_02045, partial [Ruminococcus sp.]|nr:hypothetical protein [Ruminococcus sp.]
GYYVDSEVEHIGVHPFHHAGAIYLQEPSAMSAVTMLCVKQGDRVLDLCAAPGSKTTQIAQQLNGSGLLWSNEIVRSRANILISNLERCGVKNAVVSSASPLDLCPALSGFFDKILVDAPCSGEGMFRKDKDAESEWTKEHVLSCANRQLSILNSAKVSLKAGGEMVYSTCTYSKEENEDVITKFLQENPEFELIDSGESFGRNTLGFAKRIFPMDGGEGHFAAKLRKNYTPDDECMLKKPKKKGKKESTKPILKKADSVAFEFLENIFNKQEYENLYEINDKIYALCDEALKLLDYGFDLKKLMVLKMGVDVLLRKGNRFEPCHNAFTACNADNVKNKVCLDIDDKRLYKFLHGEEIEIDPVLKGYTCVCVNGIPFAFGKAVGGVLKNKYPKGLRNNNG